LIDNKLFGMDKKFKAWTINCLVYGSELVDACMTWNGMQVKKNRIACKFYDAIGLIYCM
jgi:hypothetical protein